jgi:2-polyprenyl-3-methyl-5-hydroxy-6-metoxy-1,4-benzoquinol methylase
MSEDPRDVVRRGYDAVSYRYRADGDDDPNERGPWIDRLVAKLPAAASVLDLGCGCGIPVSQALVRAGFAVTGVDLSEVQIGRARARVQGAVFHCADATQVTFEPDSFDAVVCLYVLIHVPLAEQRPLLAKLARWLKPGGVFLVTTGYRAWTGTEDDWLGSGAPMWWAHADVDTYRMWLTRAGFTVAAEEFVAEGDGGHALFWCHVGRSEGGT